MIVYGDPSYEATLGELLGRAEARTAASSPDEPGIVLLQAGELEQAAEDGLPAYLPPGGAAPLLADLRALTDQAARDWLDGRADQDDLERAVARAVETAVPFLSSRLMVKVPEGFAFYALYPEQYAHAARQFLRDHAAEPPHERRAVVVGVRSIGTTLSAVVRVALQAGGWRAHRLTVRPAGHPFARTARIEPATIRGATWGLIVDEGPGMSGASFAAVADALVRAGLPRARIVFLPGHAGEPGGGGAASESVRAWWASAPRITAPLAELRWDGRALPDALAARAAELGGEDAASVEDLGGGLWRRVVYSGPAGWPAASVPFERPKFRVTLRSGARVLWKFAGMASDAGEPARSQPEAMAARLARIAQARWTTAPLGVALGFIALPWIEGVPLGRADAGPELLACVGRYVARAAGPPLTPGEQSAAHARLRDLLYWNVWEALGEEAAARTSPVADAASGEKDDAASSYGDGRLAPHEWLRTASGKILKTDAGGHDADHTIVGRQPLAWDFAGVLIEWDLEEGGAGKAALFDAVRNAGAAVPAPAVLHFYQAAYAAFRVGQTTLCAQMLVHDPDEQARLWRARDGYRAQLTQMLDGETT